MIKINRRYGMVNYDSHEMDNGWKKKKKKKGRQAMVINELGIKLNCHSKIEGRTPKYFNFRIDVCMS